MVKNCKLYLFLTYDILSEIMINTILCPINLIASEEIQTLKENC